MKSSSRKRSRRGGIAGVAVSACGALIYRAFPKTNNFLFFPAPVPESAFCEEELVRGGWFVFVDKITIFVFFFNI
ncbi:hypothetical protein HYC85_031613 [Camellia sinensis]|uniref:Uncharacterized protein n=1 Tax=Camellia sinensis TaxID=4442 RepID=A0A7J7FQZ7_CAMSI|nr:hypothetical protein HYC85_031613 [Camellia sinensis]